MNTFGLWDRLGSLALAGALLFFALKAHRASGRVSSWFGCAFAFLAGLFILTTFIGNWVAANSKALAVFATAGLICIGALIAWDVAKDRNPDKKSSFWAFFVLPILLVVGVAQLPQVGTQISKGGNQVMSTVGHTNGYQPAKKK